MTVVGSPRHIAELEDLVEWLIETTYEDRESFKDDPGIFSESEVIAMNRLRECNEAVQCLLFILRRGLDEGFNPAPVQA